MSHAEPMVCCDITIIDGNQTLRIFRPSKNGGYPIFIEPTTTFFFCLISFYKAPTFFILTPAEFWHNLMF